MILDSERVSLQSNLSKSRCCSRVQRVFVSVNYAFQLRLQLTQITLQTGPSSGRAADTGPVETASRLASAELEQCGWPPSDSCYHKHLHDKLVRDFGRSAGFKWSYRDKQRLDNRNKDIPGSYRSVCVLVLSELFWWFPVGWFTGICILMIRFPVNQPRRKASPILSILLRPDNRQFSASPCISTPCTRYEQFWALQSRNKLTASYDTDVICY